MPKVTATAHPNLAFVKYWGKVDFKINLPVNGSISMTLDGAKTTTSVHFDGRLKEDTVTMDDEELPTDHPTTQKISAHLDRVRQMAELGDTFAKVETSNDFPQGAGFASSAAGFAALTLAAVKSAELELDDKALSRLARAGSGSAARSVPAGFAEWLAGMDDDSSYAVQLAPPDHWDLRAISVVVSQEEKKVPSTQGHKLVHNSPYWQARKGVVTHRLNRVSYAIKERKFDVFGQETEAEAMEMHAVALTSAHEANGAWTSGVYYLEPDTLALIKAVQGWRADGLPVYFTLDAGPTVHLLCEAEHADAVQQAVKDLQGDRTWQVFVNGPAPGAQVIKA